MALAAFNATRGKGAGARALCLTLTLAAALSLSACASRSGLTTGSIPPRTQKPVTAMTTVELEEASRRVGAAYEANREDKSLGVSYASILTMTGKSEQALAVMQQVAIAHPEDREVLAAFGKAQAAAGDLQPALDTIRRAQTPDRPDWKLLSAEGAILDQMGRPDEARQRYRQALDLAPGEAAILSNLGMSYVLTNDLATAEDYLRKANALPTADSRIRQNLALVVGLQGRFAEAEQIAGSELEGDQARANVAYLREMLSQQAAWADLKEDG